MSVIIDLADVVVALLNAETFAPTFTAERKYRPADDLGDLSTLTVLVVPKTQVLEPLTRGTNRNEYTLDIGVMKRVTAETNVILDAFMDLAEDVLDLLVSPSNRILTVGSDKANWIRAEVDPIYDPESLKVESVFISVIRITYMIAR